MRKLLFLLSFVLVLNACYKDDIDELKDKYDELKKEQDRQAELLETYKGLLDALEKKLTVDGMEETEEGYKLTLSNGKTLVIRHGETGKTPKIEIGPDNTWLIDGVDTGKKAVGTDGKAPEIRLEGGYWYINGMNTGVKGEAVDGKDAPAISGILEDGNVVIFYMSDGSTITMRKTVKKGLYVLSEGYMTKNNSDLAFYDFGTEITYKRYFSSQNRTESLGDTGNDLKQYGSRLYCAVSGGGTAEGGGYIEVIDPVNGKSVKRIVVTDAEGDPDMPRRLACHGGKVYVTLYSGAVARLDTLTMAIDGRAALSGSFPEGICVLDGSLYVANSGQGSGNTLSVIDIITFRETTTISVPQNPVMVLPTPTGELYFTTASVWSSPIAPANLHKLNLQTKEVSSFGFPASRLACDANYVYTVDYDWISYKNYVKKVNLSTGEISDFIMDATRMVMSYSVNYDVINRMVYITDGGDAVYCFTPEGEYCYKVSTELPNASEVVFVDIKQ